MKRRTPRQTYTLKLNYYLTTAPDILVYGAGDVVSLQEASEILKDSADEKYIIKAPIIYYKQAREAEEFTK
jgi:hypothetical protein